MALDFLAGCVGGCAGVAVGHPLDTVKVRLQTQDPRNPTYRGTYHCLQTIVRQESARGLFKGMSSPMAGVAVINAMIFGVYGNVQRRMEDPTSLKSHAVAGAVAGLSQSVISSPMELVKTRIQVQGQSVPCGVAPYSGPADCLRQIWRGEGWRGVFRGLGVTVAREIPAFAVYFASFEAMTRQDDASKPIGTAHMMLAGGMAGMFSWLLTYPIDVVKSRLQVDGLCGTTTYRGLADCVRKTLHDEGVRGFFRGMPSTLIRSFPVNATTFTVVTWILRWASQQDGSSSGGSLSLAATESPVTYQDAAAVHLQLKQHESLTAHFSAAHTERHTERLMELTNDRVQLESARKSLVD